MLLINFMIVKPLIKVNTPYRTDYDNVTDSHPGDTNSLFTVTKF